MEEQQQIDVGTVVAINGNSYRVELVRGAGCKSCSMRGMCFGRNTPAIFDLESELELKLGDRVQLEISPGIRVFSALLVFGLPLMFLFGAFMLARIWFAELPSIGIAFTATAISFFIIRCIDRQMGGKLQVRIGGKV